jgi:succinyl-CoA:acetate CoA-transferase
MYEQRIRCKELRSKIVSPQEAVTLIKDGMNIGTSGGTYTGYPKTVFLALADKGKSGEIGGINLWTASLVGEEVDGALCSAGVLKRRLGSHADRNLRKMINSGSVKCFDVRTELLTQLIRTKACGKLDVAVVDAVAITEAGHIVPSNSPVDIAGLIEAAETVIVEINLMQPSQLEGFHDIYILSPPPAQREIPIYYTGDRIGTTYIPVPKEKIACITVSAIEEKFPPLSEITKDAKLIAQHLISFLQMEVKTGRLPPNLLPIESGLGSIADAVMRQLADAEFHDLEVYTAVLGDGVFELLERDVCRVASGTALYFSKECWNRFCGNMERYRDRLILRPVDVTDHPEVIRRLGIIALNSAVEADIYGHINSSHIKGQLLNGIGGSAAFANNGWISIFMLPSTSRRGQGSSIMPMVTHTDHSEHSVDVIVTEQGIADLRGLCPTERAVCIIEKCAHPKFRPVLLDYLREAEKMGGHEPHLWDRVFCLLT